MTRLARARAILGRPYNDVPYVASTAPGFNATYHQLDLWLPTLASAKPPYPVVLFLHGGGWSAGTKNIGPSHVSRGLLPQGVAVASVGYRLSGAAPWPAQIHDTKAAIRFLRARAARYQLNPARMGAWGYSAGAHLAVLAASTPGNPALTDAALGNAGESEALQACVGYSTPTDFPNSDAQLIANGFATRVCNTTSAEAELLGGVGSGINPCAGSGLTLSAEASPHTYIGSGSCPIRLEHGDLDPTQPYQQAQTLRDLAVTRGVACEYVEHTGEDHDFTSVTAITDVTIAWLVAHL